MKLNYTSIFKGLLISSIALTAMSCEQAKEKEATTQQVEKKNAGVEIPALLERNKVLGSKEEENLFKKKFEKFAAEAKNNPQNYKAYLGLAELYITEARVTGEHPFYYPAALKMTDHVLKQNPESKEIQFHALSLKSSIHLSLHQFQKGLDVAEKAVAINPYNANIYGALVDGNVELGNYSEAVKMTDKMVSIRPDLRSYSRVSYLREIHGDVEGAKEAMEMAVKAGYPGYESTAWARYTHGKIYENYGDLPNAEMQYRMVLEERPNYAFAMDGLANIEMKKGNYGKAEELLDEAVKIMPEISFYESLAEVYLETDRKEKSIATAKKIIEMMAEDEASGHTMDLEKAKVQLHYLDNKEEALSLAKKEYAARPKNIDVNLLLTQIYLHDKNYEKAEEHADIALATNSKNPELLLCKGMIEAKKGKKTEAVATLRKAFELNPYLNGDMATSAKNILPRNS